MQKKQQKMKLLEKLMDMMGEEEREMGDHMYPESKMKATIMADSEKGLMEGAKKLPEILGKAEEYRKMRLGSKKEEK